MDDTASAMQLIGDIKVKAQDGVENIIGRHSESYPQVVYSTVLATVCFGLILELMCLILFLYHFFKKTPTFNKHYFHFLTIGYAIAVVALCFAIFQCFWQDSRILLIGNVISEWFFEFFLGPWNLVLAINRCTALLFWKRHSCIWSWKSFAIVAALILLYPSLATAFVVLENPACFLTLEKPECYYIFVKYDKIQMISNGITVFLSTFLGIITWLVLRFKIIAVTRDTKKMETHLLMQSLISSLFFAFYCIYAVAVDLFYDKTGEEKIANSVISSLLLVLSNSYYLYFHLSTTLLLFCLSDTIRTSFIQFYSCNQIKPRTRRSSTRVTFLTSAPPTMLQH